MNAAYIGSPMHAASSPAGHHSNHNLAYNMADNQDASAKLQAALAQKAKLQAALAEAEAKAEGVRGASSRMLAERAQTQQVESCYPRLASFVCVCVCVCVCV